LQELGATVLEPVTPAATAGVFVVTWCRIQRVASAAANRRRRTVADVMRSCFGTTLEGRKAVSWEKAERRRGHGFDAGAMSDLPYIRFREVDAGTFEDAWTKAVQAVREPARLTEAELAAGWREDPVGSGLRRNVVTGEWDDSCFVHVAPCRPS
jgi:hypothetical protein